MLIGMYRRLRPHIMIAFVTSLGMLTASMWHWFAIPWYSPSGRLFHAVHNSMDYWLYTSFIRQGLDGAWLTHNLFAAEPHAGSVMYWSYLLLGQLGRLLFIRDAHVTYHMFRLVLGGVWMIVMYTACRAWISDRQTRLIAYLLMVFSASWPLVTLTDGSIRISWFMSWWSEFDPIRRAAFLPHYSLGHSLMVLSVIGFLRVNEKWKMRIFVLTVLAGFVAGFVHPPSLMILILIFPLYAIIHRKPVWFGRACMFSACASLSLLVLNHQSHMYPWSVGRMYESQSFALSISDFLLGLGPILPLGIAGFVIHRKKRFVTLLGLWVAVTVFMAWFSYWQFTLPASVRFWSAFPISNIRFLQVAPWVPLAALSALTIGWIRKRASVHIWGIVLIALIVITLAGYPYAFFGPYWKRFSVADDFSAPTIAYMDAMRSLQGGQGAVLSLSHAGSMIPAYTGRTVVAGHEVMTPSFETRAGGAYVFFAGNAGVCDAYAFVRAHHVSDVFWGFDERQAGAGKVISYPFLTVKHEFDGGSIFAVEKGYQCEG